MICKKESAFPQILIYCEHTTTSLPRWALHDPKRKRTAAAVPVASAKHIDNAKLRHISPDPTGSGVLIGVGTVPPSLHRAAFLRRALVSRREDRVVPLTRSERSRSDRPHTARYIGGKGIKSGISVSRAVILRPGSSAIKRKDGKWGVENVWK